MSLSVAETFGTVTETDVNGRRLWQTEPVHPLSTVLFIAGYGLALPLAARLSAIIATRQRLAFAGHQVGVVIALIGWLARGAIVMALLHAVWVVAARIWYASSERRRPVTAPGAGPR